MKNKIREIVFESRWERSHLILVLFDLVSSEDFEFKFLIKNKYSWLTALIFLCFNFFPLSLFLFWDSINFILFYNIVVFEDQSTLYIYKPLNNNNNIKLLILSDSIRQVVDSIRVYFHIVYYSTYNVIIKSI